jgi:N-acetylmuramoyl-L-alanine amidase/FlgD Ig-like domain
MRRTLIVSIVLLTALAVARSAFGADGGEASVRVVDLPVGNTRAPAASAGTARFTLVGIHWKGTGTVSFRTRSAEGRWSRWRTTALEDDAPDPDSPEAAGRRSWHVGAPLWVGASDRVETRTHGRVTRVRAYLVWSPSAAVPYRVPAATQRPPIVPRLSWGADESIRRAPPSYASKLRFAIVHHTAGTNTYSRDQAPAVVKAIQLYHVRGNGWNDIGYNFLVDRFGTIYEGRYGGVDHNVVGAHALGFNTGSVGIAVLGTYTKSAPPAAAQDALEKLLAWRLDLAHVDPMSKLTVVSGGSERYRVGVPVTLRAVSGHRDSGLTECPGDALYARLDAIAAAVRALGGAKIFDSRVELLSPGQVRFRAQLSSSLQWAVSIADGDGNVVGGGSGSGTTVDWTWDASAPPARYRWEITAGSARPATGAVKAGTGVTTGPLAVEDLAATPARVSPNGDGQADTATVGFTLTAPASVSVDVFDAAQNDVLPLLADQRLVAGKQSVVVDPATLVDGSYTVVVRAHGDDGSDVESVIQLTVSRLLEIVAANPPLLSPNGDGRNDTLSVSYGLTGTANVQLTITRNGKWVATPLVALQQAGPQTFTWDGSRNGGALRDGAFAVTVSAANELGTASFSVPFTIDTTPPRVRLVSRRPFVLSISEPATLTARIDGRVVRKKVRHASRIRIPLEGPFRRAVVSAVDPAGNTGAPLVLRGKAAKPAQ